jgi:hypothetical protein
MSKLVAFEVMDQRVLRVLTNIAVEQRLNDGARCVYGVDIEKGYRRRFRAPSTQVRETLRRLQAAGTINGPEEGKQSLDLYTLVVKAQAGCSGGRVK